MPSQSFVIDSNLDTKNVLNDATESLIYATRPNISKISEETFANIYNSQKKIYYKWFVEISDKDFNEEFG